MHPRKLFSSQAAESRIDNYESHVQLFYRILLNSEFGFYILGEILIDNELGKFSISKAVCGLIIPLQDLLRDGKTIRKVFDRHCAFGCNGNIVGGCDDRILYDR